MTKSRKRSSSRSRSQRGYRPPDRTYRSITSQMTSAHNRAMRDGADAELRGDAAEAFRLHRSVPFFRESTHGDRLHQLAELGDAAPGWVVNRWLTIQARRRVFTGGDELATNRMLQLIVPMVYPGPIPFEKIGCAHAEQVMPYVNELDWVVRQADVYDLGALRRLVIDHASAELLDRSDQILDWCAARMRACRIDRVDPARTAPMQVTDLTSGERVEVLDLGARIEPGQRVLGRIVPIAAEPGAMFDWRPLPVSAGAAAAVADDPRRWLTALHATASRGQLEPAYSHLPEASLTSDLPYRAWLALLDRDETDDPTPWVADAVRVALELADRGGVEPAARRHEVSELVLDPAFDGSMRWRFVSPELVDSWQRLAAIVPPAARARCEELAMWCSAAPELPDAIA